MEPFPAPFLVAIVSGVEVFGTEGCFDGIFEGGFVAAFGAVWSYPAEFTWTGFPDAKFASGGADVGDVVAHSIVWLVVPDFSQQARWLNAGISFVSSSLSFEPMGGSRLASSFPPALPSDRQASV